MNELMSTTDYDDLRPDRVRAVEVQPDIDGDWIPGDLEAIDKSDDVWRIRPVLPRPWPGQLSRMVPRGSGPEGG